MACNPQQQMIDVATTSSGPGASANGASTKTAMLTRFPPEIFDNVVDLLHDKPEALKRCCLVSKSWVPRSRKHLFFVVTLDTPSKLEAWKKTFPDPSNSPAYHAHALSVGCLEVVTTADAEEGGWVRAFSSVTRLSLDCSKPSDSFIVPFHTFSHTLKCLYVSCFVLPVPQLFNLILSLPLLEDLALVSGNTTNDDGLNEQQTAVPPSTLPAFTGALELLLFPRTLCIARRLLELPNSLHFRKLKLTWSEEGGLRSIAGLVKACSRTLECLDITGVGLLYPSSRTAP